MREIDQDTINRASKDITEKDKYGGTEGYEMIEFNHQENHCVKIVKLKGGKTRYKFSIPERDLEEKFIKGFGPGG